MQNDTAYEYSYISKTISLLGCIIVLIFYIYIIFLGIKNDTFSVLGFILITVLSGLLLALFLCEFIRRKITLSQVKIGHVGINAVVRPINYKYFPKNNILLQTWSEILDAKYFSYPAIESIEMAGMDGVKLLTNKGKIVIYKSIIGYDDLLDEIRTHIEITK